MLKPSFHPPLLRPIGISRTAGGAVSALLLAMTLAGCGDAATDLDFRVDTLNGIPHSVAADTPERRDEGLEFLWRAPDEAAVLEGTDWANPTSLAMSEDRIVVLDPQIPRVHLFDSGGERTGSFGRRGDGPGELSRPVGLGVHGDSILVTSMLASPALQWFGADGGYLGSAGTEGGGLSAATYFLPGSGILRSVMNPGEGTVWEHLDLAGERQAFRFPEDHPMQPHVSEGGSGCWVRGAAGPNIVELDCTFPLVRVVNVAGEVVREHRIARDPQRTPEHVIEEAVQSIEVAMRNSAEGVPAEMISQLISQQIERLRTDYAWTPIMRNVLGSPSGHRIILVEQLSDAFGGGPATLHVLDADGRYLTRHSLDQRIVSVAASNTRIVVMLVDEALGLRHMEAYRLP